MLSEIISIALGLFIGGAYIYGTYRLFKSDDPLGIKPNINIHINVKQEKES